jgi:iron complex transport system permease protein
VSATQQSLASPHAIAELVGGRQREARPLALGALSFATVLVLVMAVGIGAVTIHPGQVFAILGHQIGIDLPWWPYEERQEVVLLAIRLPRVLLTALVGATLALSGAAVQGLFRNPLADPALIGISSGAAFAAGLAILFAASVQIVPPWLHLVLLPMTAFVGALLATFLVYRLANDSGRTFVATMLLAGIGINSLAGAGTGLLVFVADDTELRSITFWSLGSLGAATWSALAVVSPFLLLALVRLPVLARSLNALLLGEEEARHLGIEVERLKRRIVVYVALGVGAAVSITGVIGFVGLVVPHVLRLVGGPDHRFVLPGSVLFGAVLLVAADLVSRTVVAPAELPIGIVTAFVGAPVFLWLLLRSGARQWA